MADHNLVIESGSRYGSHYCRNSSKDRSALERRFVAYYATRTVNSSCVILPSGMTAISATFQVLFDRDNSDEPIHYVLGNELYCESTKIVRRLSTHYGNLFRYQTVDVRDSKRIIEYFKQNGRNIRLFFIEACTNPSGQIFDFKLIPKLKRLAPECVICIDNTWVSGLSLNPLEHGADIVIESGTKYISDGTCISGFVVGSKLYVEQIRDWANTFGQFVGSDHCRLISNNFDTIEDRLNASSTLTLEVSTWLEAHDSVNRVMYPLLESHPTHEKSDLLKYGPSCVWFHVSVRTKKAAQKLLTDPDVNKYIKYETSFGSAHSKLDPWPKIATSDAYDFPPGKAKMKGCWIRLSIGHEDTLENIVAGLGVLFEKI
jgi:cystathionine beta-lyase/cystathionine gamma-synthase